MHESLLKTYVYMPDAISWFFVCFIPLYNEWLYGSMIVYKFVIKLSANKEAATKSTSSDCNFKFSLLTLLWGGPRSCSKLLGLFGKGVISICLTCLWDLRQNFFRRIILLIYGTIKEHWPAFNRCWNGSSSTDGSFEGVCNDLSKRFLTGGIFFSDFWSGRHQKQWLRLRFCERPFWLTFLNRIFFRLRIFCGIAWSYK